MSNENETNTEQYNKDFELLSAIVDEAIPAGADAALNNGANINQETQSGNSLAMVAINKNKRKSFAWSIRNGVNPNHVNNEGSTALMLLAINNKEDYLDFFTSNAIIDFDIQDRYGMTALLHAISYKHIPFANKLIDLGADINLTSVNKTNAIHAAAFQGNADLVQKLIKNGADVQSLDRHGRTLFHTLCHSKVLFEFDQKEKKLKLIVKKSEYEDYSKITQMLVDAGLDVNQTTKDGLHPIFSATMSSLNEPLKILLDNGANPNFTYHYNSVTNITPLLLAAQGGNVDAFTMLANRLRMLDTSNEILTNSINTKNSEGISAASMGYMIESMAQLVFDNGGDVNSIYIHEQRDEHGNKSTQKIPAFCSVMKLKNEGLLNAMIAKGAKLHWDDSENIVNPIVLAISHGMDSVAERIITSGQVDLNKTTKINTGTISHNLTPLVLCVNDPLSDQVKKLNHEKRKIKHIINQTEIGKNTGYTPEKIEDMKNQLEELEKAEKEYYNRKENIMNILLNNGADVNQKGEKGRSALFYAQSPDTVDFLLSKGADILQTDDYGFTPLTWAVKTNNDVIAAKLLDVIFDKDLVDDKSVQEMLINLTYTADEGQFSNMNLMAGINNNVSDASPLIDVQDSEGNTALIVACATGQMELAQLFLDKGADINLTNNLGETPLMHAAAHDNDKLVDFLLSKGADTTIVNKAGYSVFDLASQVNSPYLDESLAKVKVRKKVKLS